MGGIKNPHNDQTEYKKIEIWWFEGYRREKSMMLDLGCTFLHLMVTKLFLQRRTEINVGWHWTTVRSYKLPVQWYGVFKRWSLILCNFPEYPRPGVFIGVKVRAQGPPYPYQRGRECKFYNLSVIIWCESDFWRVSCHNVTVRLACLIPGRGETREGKQSCLETRRQAEYY